MPRAIDVRAEFDAHDWLRSHIWAKEGVLAGYVTLRLHGRLVIRSWPCGLNNSAVSLVRSALADHAAASRRTALDAAWSLFFCAGSLHND